MHKYDEGRVIYMPLQRRTVLAENGFKKHIGEVHPELNR